jgi:hypothetical protein
MMDLGIFLVPSFSLFEIGGSYLLVQDSKMKRQFTLLPDSQLACALFRDSVTEVLILHPADDRMSYLGK